MRKILATIAVATITSTAFAQTDVTVTIENLAPTNGTNLTPFWVGVHDGGFDLFNPGEAASGGLEALAEDGNSGPLQDMFMMSGAGAAQTVIASDSGIPPFAPGESGAWTVSLDGNNAASRYLSFAAMVLPSNDAFVGNGNPEMLEIFDSNGEFVGGEYIIMGNMVWDAGTEVNDELPMNTAFFGQMMPDTGVDENGVVALHPGFNAPGTGGILDDPMFANADFTQDGYQIARITIVPEPTSLAALTLLGALGLVRRR